MSDHKAHDDTAQVLDDIDTLLAEVQPMPLTSEAEDALRAAFAQAHSDTTNEDDDDGGVQEWRLS